MTLTISRYRAGAFARVRTLPRPSAPVLLAAVFALAIAGTTAGTVHLATQADAAKAGFVQEAVGGNRQLTVDRSNAQTSADEILRDRGAIRDLTTKLQSTEGFVQ
jgi:hypothetical protein